MKGLIKTFLMIYAMTIGFMTTFGVIYQLCGYELTDKAMWVCFAAALLVEIVYVANITTIKRKN